VKDETKPKRQSFLASEMLAMSLDNARELRRIERLKRQKRELEEGYKEFVSREICAQHESLSTLMEQSLKAAQSMQIVDE
jgi:hypothetical protein